MSPEPRRHALVTGATGGLGRAIASALGAAGWQLSLCHRGPGARAEALGVSFPEATLYEAELSTPEGIAGLTGALGDVPFDALIHCAGAMPRSPLFESTPAERLAAYCVHCDAFVSLAQRLAPAMVARGWGRLVALGHNTVSRLSAPPGIAAYYAAKAAQLAWARAFARQLGGQGVTVNVVAPGLIASGGMAEEAFAAMASRSPPGSVGRSEDVAAAVLFLLSNEAGHIHGVEWPISGAWGLS
ncbi:MAG: SDR family oxidoreductase [Myxococcales bacterium]|nr:SDR family oxidoreductase [Myxococcales bacterium]